MSNVPSWKHTTWQTPDKYPGDRHARDWLSQKGATENLANSLSLFIKTIRETIMSNRATSQLLDFSLNRGKSFPKGQEARWFFGFLWHLHCWCSSVLCNPGGVLKKVLYRKAPPRGLTPYPFIYHFWPEGRQFTCTFYWKMVPLSHTFSKTLHSF